MLFLCDLFCGNRVFTEYGGCLRGGSTWRYRQLIPRYSYISGSCGDHLQIYRYSYNGNQAVYLSSTAAPSILPRNLRGNFHVISDAAPRMRHCDRSTWCACNLCTASESGGRRKRGVLYQQFKERSFLSGECRPDPDRIYMYSDIPALAELCADIRYGCRGNSI